MIGLMLLMTLALFVYANHLPGQLGCTGSPHIQSGQYHIWNVGRVPDGELIEISLDGPSGPDFDLFLYRLRGSRFDAEESLELVASSTGGDSDEYISYRSRGAWQYLVEVRALGGSGNYEICIDANNG
jgi:hypothetical protein